MAAAALRMRVRKIYRNGPIEMKKIMVIAGLGAVLMACQGKDPSGDKGEIHPEVSAVPDARVQDAPVAPAKPDAPMAGEINWSQVPELKDIGDFPFITPPTGLAVRKENHGVTELLDDETMQVYAAGAVSAVEGRLAILAFEGAAGKEFNQRWFDRSVYGYLDGIGAKKLYQGDFPDDEAMSDRLKKNSWAGKWGAYGLLRQSDTPFAVYAFMEGGKKYVLCVQSSSAEGVVFIMQLHEFEQTIQKYTASEMQGEIEKTGKAVLNINFDTDQARLKPDGRAVVDEIFALLSANENLKVSIEGHTDNSGDQARNKRLSIERANAVMEALVAKGIGGERLKATGFGADRPITPNDTEANKAQNRRVELVKF